MKHSILVLLMLWTATAWGVPAKRTTRTVTQPDGTSLQLTMRGDECLHYLATSDGTPMILDKVSRWWLPADLSTDAWQQADQRRASSYERRQVRRKVSRGRTGQQDALVILAQFADKEFTVEEPLQAFADMFNKEGYSEYGMGGSVRDYFLAQSYGQLDIHFDVVGPVTLSHEMAYYGANKFGSDIRPAEFAAESIMLAADLVDFSHYDWDDDGEVEQIYIIFAGYGEAQSYHDDEIWPHEWSLSESGRSPLQYNGVTINTYACSNELYGKSGDKVDGIGTACHEFSHCLGLPDMYDTSGQNFGMDVWDLLDYGSYNVDGYVPASYTAYERWFAGWTEPIELTEERETVTMRNIDEEGETYVIYNRANHNEYYLLQNIQQTGWNVGAPASGMLVIHVDYDNYAWKNNKVNAVASHQRMTPLCADDAPSAKTIKSDLWPLGGKDSITDCSQPAMTLFRTNDDGRKFMGRPISHIRHENGVVTFHFNSKTPYDAITEAKEEQVAEEYYDLHGRAIARPQRQGVYIVKTANSRRLSLFRP